MQASKKKKIHSSRTTTLIISNKEINTTKNVQALEYSNILLKGVTRTLKNETREPRRGYLEMLLGTLASTLLQNMLTRRGFFTTGYGNKKEWDL